MKLKVIKHEFVICQVDSVEKIDFTDEFVFIAKTDEELSVVCTKETIPKKTLQCDEGWRAIRIEEKLDFSLIGILAKISDILAKNKIGIFVVSTYNTDIIFVKEEQLLEAIVALKQEGYLFL